MATETDELSQVKSDLLHLKAEFKRYEEAMYESRQRDMRRARHLAGWARRLKGKERALAQREADFEHRQKQFKQLKELTP